MNAGFPGGSVVKDPLAKQEIPKVPWRRKWQPTPVFLPGESHGLRSLLQFIPQGPKMWG